jgi:hypothetical protein
MVISDLTAVETSVLRVLYDRDGEAAFACEHHIGPHRGTLRPRDGPAPVA